jgi:hypothetical protein
MCWKCSGSIILLIFEEASAIAISTYHHYSCEFESISWRGVLIMWWSLSVTCDRSVVSPGSPVFSTNKTYRHDITEILFKVALSTTTLTLIFDNFGICVHLYRIRLYNPPTYIWSIVFLLSNLSYRQINLQKEHKILV